MDQVQKENDYDISLSVPIKISFKAITNYLNKEFTGKNISRTTASGKEINYFEIINLDLEPSDVAGYNIKITAKLKTLTTLYNNQELTLSLFALIKMDTVNQKFYIDTYKIDSKGNSWIVNHLLESVINTFIYKKILNNAKFELLPVIEAHKEEINEKLASKLELKNGLFLLGALQKLRITHFKVKQSDIWIITSINGWGIVDIEDLDF